MEACICARITSECCFDEDVHKFLKEFLLLKYDRAKLICLVRYKLLFCRDKRDCKSGQHQYRKRGENVYNDFVLL